MIDEHAGNFSQHLRAADEDAGSVVGGPPREAAKTKRTKKVEAPAGTSALEQRVEALLKVKGLELSRGDDEDLIPIFHPWGIPMLDEITGGVPINKFTMIYGASSHGKSLLSSMAAKSFQEAGKLAALMDAEQSFDPRWWETLGVDPRLMVVNQPDFGEQAVMRTVEMIGKADLIIVDSLADLVPLTESELDLEKKGQMGRQAQLISTFYRKALTKLRNSGTAMITINQVRDNFANPYAVSLPGGRSQVFASHIMLEVSRSEWIKEGTEKTGYVMRIKVEKNKLGLANKVIELPFSFEGKFDFLALVIADSIDKNIILSRGAYYSLPAELPIGVIPEDIKHTVREDGAHQVMGKQALHLLLESNEQALRVLEIMVYGE